MIFPKLFTLVLEDIFKTLTWEDKVIKIDGTYLKDIVLVSGHFERNDAPAIKSKSKKIGQAIKKKISSSDNTKWLI